MAQTTAETAAMTQASTQVDTARQSIAMFNAQVQAAVAATAGGYDSSAATVFRSVMGQWGDDVTKIIDGLNTIYENLGGTAKNYQGAMNLEGDSANQIAALLNGG